MEAIDMMRIFAFGLILLAGCGPAAKESAIAVSVPSPVDSPVPARPVDESARQIVAAIRNGTIAADQITVDFRKIIGEPLTPDERERGYSDSAALEWMKVVGLRLKSDTVELVYLTSNSAVYAVDRGTIGLAKANDRWLVDWLHAGRPESAPPLTGDDPRKRFTLAAFLDPLATGNFELSEAMLSAAARASLAPPLGRDVGYNRGTLRGKLKSFSRDLDADVVLWNGTTATVTLGDGRKATVTVGESSGRWRVTALDLP